MRKVLLAFFLLQSLYVIAQNVGDTIKVQVFTYESTTRDTLISFPTDTSISYEKILLKYNMRCKDALISTPSDKNKGCGEWDYSCNTYIVDSTKAEQVQRTHPDYIISNFTGDTFDYTTQQTYDRYNFTQKNVTLNSVISESEFIVGSGTEILGNIVKTDLKTGRSQVLINASELIAAGLTAGEINGLNLSVSNDGGIARFFRLKMKNTSISSLSAATLDFDGFTEVFFNDINFTNGENRIQFYTPFNWDGFSSIILELSFSNAIAENNIAFMSSASTDVRTLTASNNTSLDFSGNAHVEATTDYFNTVEDQITVAFWIKGNELMPTNNFVVHGKGEDNQRELNLHVPWGGSVYFDCGHENGTYDRIDKAYGNESVIKGQWNHWAFTKNTVSGSMRIYFNGELWHSGNSKHNEIDIIQLTIGRLLGNGNVLNAELKELSFWDKELSAQTILDWKNKSIDETHPDYDNLVSYYKFDEGSGSEVNETKHNLVDTGVNLNWKYEPGDLLTTTFTESASYPNITFYRGSYDQDVNDQEVQYLHPKAPNVVREYVIIDNEGVTPIIHDQIDLVSTNYYFQAVPEIVYDGYTSNVVSTIPIAIENTIIISELDYLSRYPFYNEIVSFVTPYGIYLDLGVNGKTWLFDVSDYVHLLKGDQRITMQLGGQWQEEMDLEFLFIVGTPPHEVLQFDQIWQGTNRTGAGNINSIVNNTVFQPKEIALHEDAERFIVKSSITGHGAEGEFHQNGGAVNHRLYIDGEEQFNWFITQECSENPIYPQGGTWVYDRQGWCPGERSVQNISEITYYVTPGSNVTLDYSTSNPGNPSGDYRYQVAHQLVGYGPPNFDFDATVEDVIAPNNMAQYTRVGTICGSPVVKIKNTGNMKMTSLKIEYWMNDAMDRQTYDWTGNLWFLQTEEVVLPSTEELWMNIKGENNKFYVRVSNPNGEVDQYSHNNMFTSNFDKPEVLPEEFILEVRTNNRASENTYYILDTDDNVVVQNNLPQNNTVYRDSIQVEGCYKLVFNDSGDDGIEWWANPNQGAGYARIKNIAGVTIKTFEPDFGGNFIYSFTNSLPISVEDYEFLTHLTLFPNPASDYVLIKSSSELANTKVSVVNAAGQQVNPSIESFDQSTLRIDTAYLPAGLYFVIISNDEIKTTRKFVVE